MLHGIYAGEANKQQNCDANYRCDHEKIHHGCIGMIPALFNGE
jgi:hypothetical protein